MSMKLREQKADISPEKDPNNSNYLEKTKL